VPNVDFANRSWRSFGSLIRPGSFRESKARDVSKKDSRHRNGFGDSAEKNVTHLSILRARTTWTHRTSYTDKCARFLREGEGWSRSLDPSAS
jgi:hypothetical protein